MSRFSAIRKDTKAVSNGFNEFSEGGELFSHAYCDHCGREFFDVKLVYVCTYASGPVYRCPGIECQEEISFVEMDE